MGKTYKRNDRWKKDRRDQNFKKSKKFKEIQQGHHQNQKPDDIPLIEEDYDGSDDIDNT